MRGNTEKLDKILKQIKNGTPDEKKEAFEQLHYILERTYFLEAKNRLSNKFISVEWEDVYEDAYVYMLENSLSDYKENDNFASYYENIIKRKAYSQIASRIGVDTNTLYILSKMKEVSAEYKIPLNKNNLYKLAALVNQSVTKCNTALESDITVLPYASIEETCMSVMDIYFKEEEKED